MSNITSRRGLEMCIMTEERVLHGVLILTVGIGIELMTPVAVEIHRWTDVMVSRTKTSGRLERRKRMAAVAVVLQRMKLIVLEIPRWKAVMA